MPPSPLVATLSSAARPPPGAQAGFVHRDLRWANVSRDANGEFFLIDLEMAGRAGGAVQFKRLREWDDNTLERAGPAGAGASCGDLLRAQRDGHTPFGCCAAGGRGSALAVARQVRGCATPKRRTCTNWGR